METINAILQANKTRRLVNFGRVTVILIGLWNTVNAAGECSMFTRQNLQNMTIHTRKLWTEASVSTPVRCAVRCKRDDACVSFFYNRDSLSCVGHSITLRITTEAELAVGNTYYVDEIGEGYIGDVCTTSAECYVTDSECRDGACWCASGYSFWPSSRSCVKYCTTYGNAFTEVSRYAITGNNEEVIRNVALETCIQSCLSATLYTCVTFEYNWKYKHCFLHSVTKFDVPAAYVFHGEYSIYQRDCLNG